MKQVELDTTKTVTTSPALQHERADSTTLKVHSLPLIPLSTASTASLAGRVTTAPSLEQTIEQIQTIRDALEQDPAPEPSYLIRLANFVGKYQAQMQQISDKDREQIQELKAKYRRATQDSANFTRDLGWNGMTFAGLSLGMSLFYLSPHQSDRDIGGMLARDFCPKLGDMFGSKTQADMKGVDAVSQLVLTEYQNKASKGQSDASSKQEILSLLDRVLQSLKEAARAG